MRRNPFASLVLGSVLVLSLWPASRVAGQTQTHWLGGTANWTSAANWSGGVVPNNGMPLPTDTYSAFIDAAGTYTVTLSTPITVTNLTMNDASATLSVGSTLTIVTNTTLTSGVIQLNSGTIIGGNMTS